VTVIGWIILSAYLALFFGAFGVFTRTGGFPIASVYQLLSVPAIWVSLEWIRSHILSGLGWNLLAYSQASWLPVIQLAEVTGALGISFLIVLVNVAIADLVAARGSGKLVVQHVIVAGITLLAVVSYGFIRLPLVMSDKPLNTIRISVVQGNIPQEQKWDPAYREEILNRYDALTQEALDSAPDLIVWPETSVPGYLGLETDLNQRIVTLAQSVKRPIIIGSPMSAMRENRVILTNSAVLVRADGSIGSRYDKVHLVPYGEFIPFETMMPWLRSILPPIGSFTPGREYTVFSTPIRNSELGIRNIHSQSPIPNPQLKFSVLICFEDIFPELARRFVNNGAKMLLNITNDAWFGPTAAAYQHAQASTFRAVELRVPVIRAANTGWSGCIDLTGRWTGSVRDPKSRSELFVAGIHTCEVQFGTPNSPYKQWGDWFAGLCLLVTVGWLSMQLLVRS